MIVRYIIHAAAEGGVDRRVEADQTRPPPYRSPLSRPAIAKRLGNTVPDKVDHRTGPH